MPKYIRLKSIRKHKIYILFLLWHLLTLVNPHYLHNLDCTREFVNRIFSSESTHNPPRNDIPVDEQKSNVPRLPSPQRRNMTPCKTREGLQTSVPAAPPSLCRLLLMPPNLKNIYYVNQTIIL